MRGQTNGHENETNRNTNPNVGSLDVILPYWIVEVVKTNVILRVSYRKVIIGLNTNTNMFGRTPQKSAPKRSVCSFVVSIRVNIFVSGVIFFNKKTK